MTQSAVDQFGAGVPTMRPGTVQTVSVSGSSAAVSNGFGNLISVIRVVSTTNCHYKLGPSPSATTSDTYLPSGVVEFIRVIKGEKIAFIQSSTAGTAYVTEMA